ncbi:hypothetical protein EJ02DRAFT_78522 [Clathrospora elynae]|uniref:Uncharacterized protein n=1 Tax=Clathrospora elynae TaxID=706981 RepID=A0A6A5T237_9PLEO|nr:hypothetical protein EJ02DRAFT_78522 [Clathrospora elynae]
MHSLYLSTAHHSKNTKQLELATTVADSISPWCVVLTSTIQLLLRLSIASTGHDRPSPSDRLFFLLLSSFDLCRSLIIFLSIVKTAQLPIIALGLSNSDVEAVASAASGHKGSAIYASPSSLCCGVLGAFSVSWVLRGRTWSKNSRSAELSWWVRRQTNCAPHCCAVRQEGLLKLLPGIDFICRLQACHLVAASLLCAGTRLHLAPLTTPPPRS